MQAVPACSVRIVSWNLLAPIFVRCPDAPYSAFTYASDEDLDWNVRQRRITAQLLACDADVFALQEVQLRMTVAGEAPQMDHWFDALRQAGYVAHFQDFKQNEWDHQLERNERVIGRLGVTCNATLFRASVFELVSAETTSRALVLVLRHRASQQVFSVANVHLEGHPDLGDMRLKQLHSAIKKGRRELSHLVVAGDFNQRDDCGADTGLQLVATGPSWCDGSEFGVALDHIVFDSSTLAVGAVHKWYDGKSAIPSAAVPSDHAPIGCTLRVVQVPRAAKQREPDAVPDDVQRAMRARFAETVEPLRPAPVKGKPNAEQLVVLREFAQAKKAFCAAYQDNEQMAALAKQLCDQLK